MPLFDWDLEFMLDLAVARMVDLVSQSPKVTQVEELRLMQVFRGVRPMKELGGGRGGRGGADVCHL